MGPKRLKPAVLTHTHMVSAREVTRALDAIEVLMLGRRLSVKQWLSLALGTRSENERRRGIPSTGSQQLVAELPPVPFFGWEGSPKYYRTKKKTVGTLFVLSSLLEDLAPSFFRCVVDLQNFWRHNIFSWPFYSSLGANVAELALWSLASSQLSKANLLTFWFSNFGPCLVEVPEKVNLLVLGPLGN